MRAVYSFESLADSSGGPGTTARQLAESLSSLALPEDYALQVGTYTSEVTWVFWNKSIIKVGRLIIS